MSNTKRMFRFFTIADYKEEEKFLSEQHSQGWEISHISIPGIYTFKRCEKEDYIYQLDFPDLGNNSKRDYVRMFEDCGWEYLFDFVQFSYFRIKKDDHKEQSIFTDDESKIEMIDKIFKRRMLPIMIIFFAVLVPNMTYSINFDSSVSVVLSVIFLLLMVLYIVLITSCGFKLKKLKEESKK